MCKRPYFFVTLHGNNSNVSQLAGACKRRLRTFLGINPYTLLWRVYGFLRRV